MAQSTSISPAKARPKSEADIDTLKSDMATLREDVSKLIDNMGSIARRESGRGLEKGRQAADQAAEKLSDARSSLEERVRENPLAAIGLAVGAGVLLSTIMRR